MSRGSKKPILAVQKPPVERRPEPTVELRDGRTVTVTECLLDAGDLELAADRADMSKLAFSRLLVQVDPYELAEVLRAIRLMGVFMLTDRIEQEINRRIDEIRPVDLLRMYPDYVGLLPELAMAPIHIQATQNNLTVEPTGSTVNLPAHVREALQALGIDPDRAPAQELQGSSQDIYEHEQVG